MSYQNLINATNVYLKQNVISSFKFQCVGANDGLNIISYVAPQNSCGINHIYSIKKNEQYMHYCRTTDSHDKSIVVHRDFSRLK